MESSPNTDSIKSVRALDAAHLWRVPSLDALIFTGVGLAFLFIGSWVPDERLTLEGVPLNTILLSSLILFVPMATVRKETLYNLLILQIPFLIILLSMLWSPLPEQGLNKLTTLLFPSTCAFLMMNTVVEKYGIDELARLLIGYLGLLLLAAIVYKLQFGFFKRDVRFLLNGPIIFARFMTIVVILSLFYFRGKQRVITATVFTLAVIWTESKGPILAVFVSLLGAIWFLSSAKKRVWLLVALAVVGLALFVLAETYGISQAEIGRLAILLSVLTGDFAKLTNVQNAGTVASRWETWSITAEMIYAHPMGVGLGGWEIFADRKGLQYPHNLFLELWSEVGVVLGTVAALPFVYFFFVRRSIFWFIALALFLSQMVSGDLGDARLCFTFALLACFSKPSNRQKLRNSVS